MGEMSGRGKSGPDRGGIRRPVPMENVGGVVSRCCQHPIALLGDTQWGEYSPENITVVFLIFKLECFVSFLIVQHWSSLLK